MAAHFCGVTGRHLVLILEEDGWKVRKEQQGRAMLEKDGHHSIHLTLTLVHPKEKVERICKNTAKINAERFDELYRSTASKLPQTNPSAPPRIH